MFDLIAKYPAYFRMLNHVWFGNKYSILAWGFFMLPGIIRLFDEDTWFSGLLISLFMFFVIPGLVMALNYYQNEE